ncbi:type II secretion system protein GspE [Rouxiella silvae]|uniref:Type II secretion system protein GspE n=1 Tax=Rouxiella silvae TaxID=1646373 RepID=A0ABX3U1D3_9GAMM|nr:type II secretion system protein GspE [Rouxiella silvae]KQN49411.1 transporter HofB [Serratia sp. Leaf50]ORJ21324.1 type II secretion system protein GspE [Rouxiella silvae]
MTEKTSALRDTLRRQCQHYGAVLIAIEDESLRVACHQETTDSTALLTALRFTCALKVNIEFWPQTQLEHALSQPQNTRDDTAYENQHNEDHDVDEESKIPVVQFLNHTLKLCIQRRASDVHFEPFENQLRVRLRIDGVLQELPAPEFSLMPSVLARLKIMGQLNVAEHRLPQDGQMSVTLDKQRYSLRISSLPVLYGEKIVLRILDRTQQELSLEQLGFSASEQKKYLAALDKPQGLILVTGPTGSGKTVTLYTGLRHLNTIRRNICSVEDPVEIPVRGINQTQINSKASLSFAKVLRSLLRQDPDVIMIGEIRDAETAEIAVKASQTGHLVLSTLHTNSTTETLVRLAQMGVEGYQIAASLRLVIAQRLVRKLCPHCKTRQRTRVKAPHQQEAQEIEVWQAQGCKHCFSGYYGRVGVYEMLENSPQLQQALVNGADSQVLRVIAAAQSQQTLFASGISLVEQGTTSLSELYRVMGEGERGDQGKSVSV